MSAMCDSRRGLSIARNKEVKAVVLHTSPPLTCRGNNPRTRFLRAKVLRTSKRTNDRAAHFPLSSSSISVPFSSAMLFSPGNYQIFQVVIFKLLRNRHVYEMTFCSFFRRIGHLVAATFRREIIDMGVLHIEAYDELR